MIIFFIFYVIYWFQHFYLFLKINSFSQMSTGSNTLLGLFLFFMTLSPLLIHLYSLRGSTKSSRVFAYIGYLWMALIFFFSPTALLFDFYNLLIRLSGTLLQQDLSRTIFSPLSAFLIPLFISTAITTYGYFEAKNLQVERLTLKTSKLPEGIDKLTIAHISDLHLGLIVRENILDTVIREIETAKPDLIVSTGDLLDGEINHIDYLAERLKRVQARLGKFAAIGNHEFFIGLKHSLEFMENAGFTVLRGDGVTVQGLINIAGVDDPVGKSMKPHKNTVFESEREILSKLPPDLFTLLLKHRPDIDKDAPGLFDLQLSGHTHKGQMFPFNFVTKFFFHAHAGYTTLSNGSAIYVSRGAGTTCSPVRFLSPPEITIIELIKEPQCLPFRIPPQ